MVGVGDMKLVDVHTHVNSVLYKDDFEEMLERAKKAGVKAILLSGVNPEANREVLALVKKYPLLRASFGIYPIDALGLPCDATGLPQHQGPIDLDTEFAFIRKNLALVAAIGEIGMDFHWSKEESEHRLQEEIFRKIIRFVKSIKKPIVIHSRQAEKECVRILNEEITNKEIPVVNHAFSGGKKVIIEAAKLGHYFSIPANIMKSEQLQMLVSMVDITQLLTETDAPWLSPYSGQRNEPAFVIESIRKIAAIKGISEKDAAEAVWNNYCRVFGE